MYLGPSFLFAGVEISKFCVILDIAEVVAGQKRWHVVRRSGNCPVYNQASTSGPFVSHHVQISRHAPGAPVSDAKVTIELDDSDATSRLARVHIIDSGLRSMGAWSHGQTSTLLNNMY